jgi:putative DNA primase/helicase
MNEQEMAPITALRIQLHAKGYDPIPLDGKRPLLPSWQRIPIDRQIISSWSGKRTWRNTGVRCGAVRAIDIDILDADLSQLLAAECERIVGRNSLRRIGRAPKTLIPYFADDGAGPKLSTPRFTLPDGSVAQVEILGAGNQFAAYGLHPDTGAEYEWQGGGLDTTPATDLPRAKLADLQSFLDVAADLIRRHGGIEATKASAAKNQAAKPPQPRAPACAGARTSAGAEWPAPSLDEVAEALRRVPNGGLDWAHWHSIGAAIYDALGEAGRPIFLDWSAQCAGHDPKATEAKWRSYATSTADITRAYLFRHARDNGWKPSTTRQTPAARKPAPAQTPAKPDAVQEAPEPEIEEWSEDGVARIFERINADRLRHVDESANWLRWDGAIWRSAAKGLALTWARNLIHRQNRDETEKTRNKSGTVAFCRGVETFAMRGPLAIQIDRLDRDEWLLGTPGGTVDLRSGMLRPSRPDEYITKATAVSPAPSISCPTWLRFLEEATGQDDALIRFLAQWAGYCLTGSTREHALLFLYGGGGNGKSVFLNTIAAIMGDHAEQAPLDAFHAAQGDRHPADVAMMRGARLVVASETEEGRQWAEAKIKALTGGDKITARFMRQDFFTFTPAFKLTVAGNHKPGLRNVDEAMRRRFLMVPFNHRPADPDPDLAQKLRAEWPGILAWMIEGCRDWQRHGLIRPDAVTAATRDYFDAQDVMGRWLKERCIIAAHLQSKPAWLLSDYREWAAENGEQAGDSRRLRGFLERTPGCQYKTVRGAQKVTGIGLRPHHQDGKEGGGVERGGGENV